MRSLTNTQKEQYRIMDNTLNSYTGYKEDTLKELLSKLKEEGIDLNSLVLHDTFLAQLAENDELTPLKAANEKDELNIPAVVQKGDLWLLGKHRLYYDDSLKGESYKILISGQ